jgi:uncharacterized protein YndB with AHSA1/START domain
MKRKIRIEIDYPHAPEKIWRALTDSKLLARWLMENDFEPQLGREFTFRMKPQPGFDGIVRCEVLELDAPHRLSWAWRGGPLVDSRVGFTLSPTPTGTRVLLEHTGFEGMKAVLLSFLMGGGWGKMLRKRIPAIVAELDGGTIAVPQAQECETSWGKRLFAQVLRLIPGRG